MSPPHLPKRVFPIPYQVDFSVELNGRHVDSTKRRLTWKVGFAHPPSVFPHLYDADENYVGDKGSILPYPENPKKGIECRGREHEIILTWSILSGKAHIYVDSREIIRHEPLDGSIFSPFSSQFHKGFDLPNPELNGHHRINIRCYARTPMGLKGTAVDDKGGRFRQYDLTVDGLSFFNMPVMYELGTDRMWEKVSRWGLIRADSSSLDEESSQWNGTHERRHTVNGDFDRTGRMVDEYYFDKAKRKSETYKYGQSISDSEYKAMNPRSESEEVRMMRIAMEASLKDWDEDHGCGKASSGSSLPATRTHHTNSSEENNSASSNLPKNSRRTNRQNSGVNGLSAIGEDENLIDFGVDDAARAISHIDISRQRSSDVSVLADDDATTASFMMNTAWNSGDAQKQQRPAMPAQQPLAGQIYSQNPTPYHDPTFRTPYTQQPWNTTRTVSTPTSGAVLPSADASFAVPPPPTWDDYNDAFGGTTTNTGASVMGGSSVAINPMSPASTASVGMTSPMAQRQAQQYGLQRQAPPPSFPQWQSQTQMYGAPGGGGVVVGGGAPVGQVRKTNQFDPLRSDPFADPFG